MSHDGKSEAYRKFRSHWIPRTSSGKGMLVFFVLVYLLAEWPILELANSIEPRILGFPLLFVWLSGVYLALILGLLYTALRRL